MKAVIEVFEKLFMLTSENEDPRDLDFTFYTHERIISNEDGMPGEKEYYMNYDSEANEFSDLAVKCTYTYTYNEDGLLTKRVEDIDWYFADDTVGVSRQMTQVIE